LCFDNPPPHWDLKPLSFFLFFYPN
jgi:hypothetical protein